jgi:cytochrome c-type biogenesis protein CcmH
MRRAIQIVLIGAMALLMLGADLDRARFEKVGHELMCTCGCSQVLLECNHVGCPVSDGMRKQVADGIIAGKSDEAILASFVQQVGPTVLAAPTKKGFDIVAWVTPPAILLLAIGVAVWFVRRWRGRAPLKEAPVVAVSDPRLQQVREETRI